MSTNGPPSPAFYTGSDWSNGPRGHPPNKVGSPGAGTGGRANLPTPPISGSSNGSIPMNGMPAPGPGGPGGLYGPSMGNPRPRGESRSGAPSPPQSLGRLSTSSNMSTRDPEQARRRQAAMEEALNQHYVVLRQYLQSDLRRDKEGKSQKARDKLLRLSPIQFHELSTDIYDELRRRQNAHRTPPHVPAFLPPKENFHPKRNQARQKLSTLPETRFRDLATDVFFELERRFPRFTGRDIGRNGSPANGMRGPPGRAGTPSGFRGHNAHQDSLAGGTMNQDGYAAQKSMQSSTIVPNKSYLVEDDDDGDLDSVYGGGRRDTAATSRSFNNANKLVGEFQVKVEELQGKVSELERQLQEKDEELDQHKSSMMTSSEADDLRRSLERKLISAQELNRNLQEEIDNARAEKDRAEQEKQRLLDEMTQHDDLLADYEDLKTTHEDLIRRHESTKRELEETSGGGEWRERCEDLEGENQDLRRSVQEQQQLTQEVRSEATGYLNEMRTIMEQSDHNFKQEQKLKERNSQLETELQDWKDKYAKAKAQLRTAKTASMGLAAQQPSISQSMKSPSGLIKDVDITRFQLSIDDALRTARSGEPNLVLDSIKMVVNAVKPMVRDASTATDPKTTKLRNRLIATVNNFITAGRNYVQSGGISPISLLDAAASHLSAAIVEFAAIVKIRSSALSEPDRDDNVPVISHQPLPTNRQALEIEDDEDDMATGYYNNEPVTNGGYTNGPNNGHQVLASTPASPPQAEPGLPSSRAYQLPSTIYQKPEALTRKPVGSAPSQPQITGQQFETPVQAQPPSEATPNGEHSGGSPEPDLDDLKHFLDEQTSALITSIQSLVTSIRGSAPPSEVQSRLALITSTSSSILHHTEQVISMSSNQSLHTEASPLVQTLQGSYVKLQNKEREGDIVSEGTPEWKKWCQGVPPIAFEIARIVKDLGGKVTAVVNEAADDFS